MQIQFKSYFRNPLLRILAINENLKPNLTGTFGKCCIIFYFFQILSYLFGLYYSNDLNKSDSFGSLSLIFYYSNSKNLLDYISDLSLFEFVYSIAVSVIYIDLVIQAFYFFYFQTKRKIEQTGLFKIFSIFFLWFGNIHQWILILLINDVFFYAFRDEAQNNLIFSIFTLMNIGFNIYLGLFNFWFNQSIGFYENTINFPFETLTILIALIKLIISIFSHFFVDMRAVYYVLFHAFFVINFLSFRNYPIRNKNCCKLFLGFLFVYEAIVICMSFFEFTGILDRNSLFYVGIVLASLGFRLGIGIYEKNYVRNTYLDIPNNQKIFFFLEEMYFLQKFNTNEAEKQYIFSGILAHHFKRSEQNEIKKLKENHQNDLGLSIETDDIVCNVIMLEFKRAIISVNKNSEIVSRYLLKFLSFLIKSDLNPIASYLEIQKTKSSLKLMKLTFFEEIYLDILLKQLKKKIKDLKKIKNLNQNEESEGMAVETFFKVLKVQSSYEKQLKELVKAKKAFWDYYQMEISSSQDLMTNANKLSKQIENFRLKLFSKNDDASSNKAIYLIQLKYLSIFHAILLNSLNMAFKYEDEYFNLMKRVQDNNSKNLQSLSFLDDKIATLMISFIGEEGRLLEESKIQKTAEFFGYSPIEFRNIKNLSSLIPQLVGTHHDEFIKKFLQKKKYDLKNASPRIIESFAVNRDEFIFPVRIFPGLNLNYKNDFVMIAAIMKTKEEEEYIEFICDENANIMGFSKKCYQFFKERFNFLEKSHFKVLNLCFFSQN